ncbi:MAG TPA: hypothetical protein VGI12_07350 [Vicinamibacterales bacterium]
MSSTAGNRRTRERRIVFFVVIVAVIWRSAVLVFWQQAQFDSDQAVFGLMAKHLSEGRAFPVFMYGQSYILGVEAWMAAPLFLLFGPSVAALKLPLLIINVTVAVLLLRLFEREGQLRPLTAAVAAAPFVLPAPGTAAHLLEPSGGNLEPFLYTLLMWMCRTNPILCGAILGVGFLHREFTVYAAGALCVVWAVERTLFTRQGLARVALMVSTAGIVWVIVQQLQRVSSAAGPGTTIADLGTAPNNLMELVARTCIAPSTLLQGGRLLLTEHWPQLFGTAPYPLSDFSIESGVSQGLAWASLLPLAAMLIAGVAIARAGWPAARRALTSIPGYLTLVGCFSVAGYVAGRCGSLSFYTMRYELLSLLGAAGVAAWFFSLSPSPRWTRPWLAAVACWTLLACVSHARLWHEYLTHPPVGAKREVMRMLEQEGVRYGTADYWIAYYITFLTDERIILASSDFVRIRTYNVLVEHHAAEAVRISRTPCAGGRMLVPRVYQCP